MPVSPPMRNIDKNPHENNIGEANEIRPPYMVANQLKNLMPVGIETRKGDTTKKRSAVRLMPTENIWWAQPLRLRKAMAAVAAAMNSKPNRTLRAKTGM